MKTLCLILSLPFMLSSSNNDTLKSQWRGINRDGIYHEKNLLKKWPEAGPTQLWNTEEIGDGWGSVAVSPEGLFTTGTFNKQDFLIALDSKGKVKWKSLIGASYKGSYPKARCTPTIVGQKIYALSGMGFIGCFDAETGKKIWGFDAYSKFSGNYGRWGVSENLLVVDGKVFYTPGGQETTMVALDAGTGKTVWKSKKLDNQTAYVSPIIIERAGKKIVVNLTANLLFGLDASNGEVLWSYNYSELEPPTTYPKAASINCTTPLYKDGYLYITSGYNHIGAMFTINKEANAITLAWKDSTLDCHHGGVVRVGDAIYGSNWINNRKGNWCSIDWKTGKKNYEAQWKTKGSIIAADGMLYCYEEKTGSIALVNVQSDKFDLVSSFQIKLGKGPHWAHPVIHDGTLYIRHGQALMAYDIRARK